MLCSASYSACVFNVLKQLFTSVSVKVVDIYLATFIAFLLYFAINGLENARNSKQLFTPVEVNSYSLFDGLT